MLSFKIRFLIILMFSICTYSVSAQLQMDSLNQKLAVAEGEELVSTQLIVASRLVLIDPDKADSLVRLTIKTSKEEGYTENWILGLTIFGGLLSNQGKRDSAELVLQMAIDEGQKIGFNKGITGAHMNYGALLIREQEYDSAVYHHIKGYEAASLDSTLNVHAIVHLMNLGIIKQTLEDYDNAYSYFQNALDISERIGQEFRSAQILANMGLVAYKQKNYGLAIESYEKAFPVFYNSKSWLDVARTRMNQGLSYSKIQNHEQAIDFFYEAVDAWKKRDDRRGEHLTYRYLAEVYLETDRLDESEAMLKKSIPVLQEYTQHQYLSEAYALQFRIDKSRGRFEKALNNYQLSIAYQDTIRNKTRESELNKALARFDIQRLERENELVRDLSELKIQKQNQAIVVIITLMVLSVVGFLWNRSRLRTKLKLQELTSQISQQEIALKTSEFESEKERLQAYTQKLLNSYESLKQKQELLEQQITDDHHRENEIEALLQRLRDSISNENDWTAFRLYFDRAYPNFFDNLKHRFQKDLTLNENRLISLMKIQLTNKEIATALNIQRDSVVKAKIRLKEKLGCKEMKEMEEIIVALA